MSEQIKTFEPEELIVGDTWKWRKAFKDFLPSDSWGLTYALVSNEERITLTGTDNGDGSHLIEVSAATTADYKAGQYAWQAYLTKNTERYSRGFGYFEIVNNFATLDGGSDVIPDIKKQLDALEAMLLGRASKDQQSMSVGGRSISRLAPREIIEWRNILRAEWRAKKAELRRKSGLSASRKIKMRL